ncbi:MAG: aldehyde dehydrogenase family protein [Myxococcota bacterium]
MQIVTQATERLREPQKLFIDGRFVDARTERLFDVTNPATCERLAQVHEAGPEDVDRAVRAARRAFEDPAWRRMHPSEREKLLLRIADGLDAWAEEIGAVETLNNGKTLREGRGDVEPSADIFRYYAGWSRHVQGETIPIDGDDFVYTLREPVGVCGQIVPWNYPLLMASWKVAPALACGNTVILKPSEWTPLTALMLAQVCKDAGVPDGVVNVLPGYGEVAGAALAGHLHVDKLAFTGSVETARKLLHASAESNLKKLSLELGGKSPLVVLPDADIEAAARAAFWGIFANKGEVCSASSRLLAHRDIKEPLVGALADMANDMKVGDPLDPDNSMGALVSQAQLDKVMHYIETGKDEGARLVAGGSRITEGSLARGLFVRPTVFDDVTPDMRIAREEIFGPVLGVLSFDDEADAVRLANATTYGLVASVFTKDITRAHRVARDLQAGVVWVNRYNGFDSAAPFGGFKQSGWGREMGQHALEHYTQTKCVWVAM